MPTRFYQPRRLDLNSISVERFLPTRDERILLRFVFEIRIKEEGLGLFAYLRGGLVK